MKIKIMRFSLLFALSMQLVLQFIGISYAAYIKNADSKPQTVIIIEGSSRHDLILQTNQQEGICLKGCFVTLANGDRFYLKGDESVEINNNGRANFK